MAHRAVSGKAHAAVLLAGFACLVGAHEAKATTLGVGDRADGDPRAAQLMGARAYRVVIDPATPLSAYDARIWAHYAVGQQPQLVIGGTGTVNHGSSRGVVRAAVAAARRWPYAFSVGVINEPNESGMGVCEYDRTWLAAYSSLRAVGVRRIPFGEWSPNNTLAWHAATLNPHRCHNSARRLASRVKYVAWHGYGAAIEYGPALRFIHRQYHAVQPRLLVTEAGAVLRFHGPTAGAHAWDLMGLRYWRWALHVVKRDRITEIVAWDVHSPDANAAWDSSLIEPTGRPRPAFWLIAKQFAK